MSKELLFEIGCEELPAAYAMRAVQRLPELFTQAMRDAGGELQDGVEVRALGTPRRLALQATGLPAKTPKKTELLKGPPARVAYKDDQPTPAAVGFAKRLGIPVDALRVEDEYVVGEKTSGGESIVEVLARALPALIEAIPFPKTMRWGSGDERFARPVRWIVAVFDAKPVPFAWGQLEAGTKTRGHRFLSPDAFGVKSFSTYVEKLRKAHVLVDPDERREAVRAEVQKAAEQAGGTADDDPGLLDIVTYLVEDPTGVTGRFDDSLLALPPVVIVTPMKHHQRYFPVLDKANKLKAAFVTVAGTPPKDPAVVAHGNERVLAARLADAKFFFDEDLATPMDAWVERLDRVVFQNELGSYGEKVRRMGALATELTRHMGGDPKVVKPEDNRLVAAVQQATTLCKADLNSKMVYEFPELQGTMGREYALRAGIDAEVADAIEQHYQPRSADDDVPAGTVGALLSLADRFDTLAGIFGIGERPSGSADPFGLRRHALAILSILRAKGWSISVSQYLERAADLLAEDGKIQDAARAAGEASAFVRERFYHWLVGEELAYDAVDAVLEAGFDDVRQAVARARALTELKGSPDLEPVATAFRRAANILAKADPDDLGAEVDPKAFDHDAEGALRKTLDQVSAAVTKAADQSDWAGALGEVVKLRKPIDAFYDAVMVMDQDHTRRRNRLALLTRVTETFAPIADFSKIVVAGD